MAYSARPSDEELQRQLAEHWKRVDRRNDFFRALGLPITVDGNLDAGGVYDILTDKDKLRELITKLNNKAFW